MPTQAQTAVLEVAGVQWASQKATVEAVLGRRPGVLAVEANPVGQTAVVTYDTAATSIRQLSAWVRDCGYHCAGQSVPRHVCDPAAEPHDPATTAARGEHGAALGAQEAPVEHAGHAGMSPQAMGHGGHHDGMSMADMVRDMRNRFLVAAVLS